MAGLLARRLRAKVLFINHVSSSLDDQAESLDLVNSIKETNENQSQVVVGQDFLQLHVPKGGYAFPTTTTTTTTTSKQTNDPNMASRNEPPPSPPSSNHEPIRIVPPPNTTKPTSIHNSKEPPIMRVPNNHSAPPPVPRNETLQSSSKAKSMLNQLKYLFAQEPQPPTNPAQPQTQIDKKRNKK
jgi:hypothetical protein